MEKETPGVGEKLLGKRHLVSFLALVGAGSYVGTTAAINAINNAFPATTVAEAEEQELQPSNVQAENIFVDPETQGLLALVGLEFDLTSQEIYYHPTEESGDGSLLMPVDFGTRFIIITLGPDQQSLTITTFLTNNRAIEHNFAILTSNNEVTMRERSTVGLSPEEARVRVRLFELPKHHT